MIGLTPCRIIQSKCHAFVKRRIWPIRWMRNETMLHRIEMHVIHMGAIIPLITNGMFPKTLLPNAPPLTRQNLGPFQFRIRQGFGKPLFDGAPPAGIIRIIFRQGPYAMQVVRQNHPRIRMKWRRPANRTNGGPERFDFPHQQVRPVVCQIYSKEVRSSRNAIAAIVGHCGNVSTFLAWWNTLIHAGCGVGVADGRGGVATKTGGRRYAFPPYACYGRP